MTTAVNKNKPDDKKKRAKRILSIGCGGVLLITIACVSLYFLFIRGVGGEPANASTIEKTVTGFVTHVQSEQFALVNEMLTDQLKMELSENNLRVLSAEEMIANFKRLDVCEFQVFSKNEGKALVGYGLFYYGDEVTVFESTLLQGNDKIWRLSDFHLKPELDTTPWGGCQYD